MSVASNHKQVNNVPKYWLIILHTTQYSRRLFIQHSVDSDPISPVNMQEYIVTFADNSN